MNNPTTCKYFLRGTCRYGDRCRFYHPPGAGGFGVQDPNSRVGVLNQIQDGRVKINENLRAIEDAVKKDMVEWEKGNIWPFSCYGPTGGKPNLEGFEDVCPEELRWATLQNGGVPPNNLAMRYQQWKGSRAKWQQSTVDNLAVIEQLIFGQPKSGAVSSTFQQTQPGGFGIGTSFGSPSTGSTLSTSAFSSVNPSGAFGPPQSNTTLNNFSFSLDGGTASSNPPSLPSFSFNQTLTQTQPVVPGFQSASQLPNENTNQGFGVQSAFSTLGQGFLPGTPQQPVQAQPAFGQGFTATQNPVLGSTVPVQQNSLNLRGFQVVQKSGGTLNPVSSFVPLQNQRQESTTPSSFGSTSNFGSSVFPRTQPTTHLRNTEQGSFTGFGGAAGDSVDNSSDRMDSYDKTVYSDLSDLTPTNVQAFEAPCFQANALPLQAPAKKFCL